jgi:hypothetical protein
MLNYTNLSICGGTHSNHLPSVVVTTTGVVEIALWPENGRFLDTYRMGDRSFQVKANFAPKSDSKQIKKRAKNNTY